MRPLAWTVLAALVAACGGGGSAKKAGCTSAADCGDQNLCSTDRCDAGTGSCAHAYDPAMATALLAGSLAAGSAVDLPIATSSGGTAPLVYTICPGGPDASANPKRCVVELDVAHAALGWQAQGGTAYRVTGTLPARIAYLPIDATYLGVSTSAAVSVTGNHACAPAAQTFVDVPVDVSVDLGTPPSAQLAYTIDADAIAAAMTAAAAFCSGPDLAAVLAPLVQATIAGEIRAAFAEELEAQLCARPAEGPCPPGSADLGDGVCRFSAGGPCATRPPAPTGLVVPRACVGP